MSQRHRIQHFDDWAKDYDSSIKSADHAFPFDGYEEVLDEIVRQAEIKPSMLVLDLGIGTGNLAGRFIAHGCNVWGIDFSSIMLEKAQAKLPQAHLVQADIFGGWPLRPKRYFDRIVSAYVLHEFDLVRKISLLQRLALHHLSINGRIVIGDIAFLTAQDREQTHARWTDRWDEDEHYWVADEAIVTCNKAGLQAVYSQVSSCGGVFVIESIET